MFQGREGIRKRQGRLFRRMIREGNSRGRCVNLFLLQYMPLSEHEGTGSG